MELTKQLEDHLRILSGMPPWKLALLFAACAERHFPLYKDFTKAESWGSSAEIRACLDHLWQAASSPQATAEIIGAVETSLLRNIPHSDDFEAIHTVFAQDVVTMIHAGACQIDPVLCRESKIPTWYLFEAVIVAGWYNETGDCSWSTKDAAAAEAYIVTSPMYLAEWQYQQEDLREMQRAGAPTESLSKSLRTRADTHQYSVAGLLRGPPHVDNNKTRRPSRATPQS